MFPFKFASLVVFIALSVERIHRSIRTQKRQITFKTSVFSVSPSQLSPCLFCQSICHCVLPSFASFISVLVFLHHVSHLYGSHGSQLIFLEKMSSFFIINSFLNFSKAQFEGFICSFISTWLHASSSLFLQWVSPRGSRKTTVDDLIICHGNGMKSVCRFIERQ